MTAFFASIRNFFKSEYHGRYLSVILQQIAQHEPRTFSLILEQVTSTSRLPFWREVSAGILNGELTVRCEHSFEGYMRTRRADLAVLRGDQPVVLMEVKEFDRLSPSNPDQLGDYLGKVSKSVGFVHVHRFLPPFSERSKIDKKIDRGWPVALLSYDQIYKAVTNAVEERRALGALLCDYLEDIGVGIYRPVSRGDRKALAFLMAQMLGFPHQAGMGKLQSDATVRRGPQLLSQLLGNIEVIAEWVRLPNEKIMRTHCSKRFWIEPWLHHKRLRNDIRDAGDVVDELPRGLTRYVEGGELYFVANVGIRSERLGKNNFLHLKLGFGLQLEKAGSSIRCYAYTGFDGSGLDFYDTYAHTTYSTKFPSESFARDRFAEILGESKRKLLKITSGETKRLARQIAIPDVG